MDINDSSPRSGVNTTRAIEVLTELCDAFQEGLVSGDSCNRLCYYRDWKVTDYYEGNKVVLVLKDGGQTAVLKSIHPSMSDFARLDRKLTYDQFSDKVVLSLVNDELRLGWPRHYKKHLMEVLWPT
ncbi:hypothetical protein ANCCAN_29757, partial [Ancylostoma caninum]